MTTGHRRGQPLWVMGIMFGAWVGARAMTWEPLIKDGPLAGLAQGSTKAAPRAVVPLRRDALPPRLAALPTGPAPLRLAMLPDPPRQLPPGEFSAERQRRTPPASLAPAALIFPGAVAAVSAATRLAPAPAASGGQEPSATAFDVAPPSVAAARGARPPRWSGDGWVLLRPGGGVPNTGAAFPTYGASQAGAVARYRLDPGAFAFTAYVRATAALGSSDEREAAVGISARPMPGLPVIVMGEVRVSQFEDGTAHVRPAVALVSAQPPINLPAQARAEVYAQGGYVGGALPTLFFDGQLRVDRKVAMIGPAELRAGGGAWGGAQEGASRLDIGPGVTARLSEGRIGARMALDWRFRVAGDAAPHSGPALTLSAGF